MAGASAQGPAALGREGSDPAGSVALPASGRLAAMPTLPGEAEAAAALAAQHNAVNAYKGAYRVSVHPFCKFLCLSGMVTRCWRWHWGGVENAQGGSGLGGAALRTPCQQATLKVTQYDPLCMPKIRHGAFEVF